MAHVAKFAVAATGNMFNHYARTTGDGKNRKNVNIDPARTDLNYNLAAELQPLPQIDFLRKKLTEVKVQKRKDVNVICDWVVTLPKDVKKGDEEKFFQSVFDFLGNKYGKNNVISAYVHMDETTPHMHFAFVPVVEDRRKGGYKVSAKELITRKELNSFHPALSKAIEKDLGYAVEILNEATKAGNIATEDLKKGTTIKKIAEQKQDLEIEKARTAAIRAENELLQEINGKRHELEVVTTEKPKYSLFGIGFGEKQVEISVADFEKMRKWVDTGLNAVDYLRKTEKIFVECREMTQKLMTSTQQAELLKQMEILKLGVNIIAVKSEEKEAEITDLRQKLEISSEYAGKYRELEEKNGVDFTFLAKAVATQKFLDGVVARLGGGFEGRRRFNMAVNAAISGFEQEKRKDRENTKAPAKKRLTRQNDGYER